MCVTLGQNKEMSRPDLDNASRYVVGKCNRHCKKEKVAHEFSGMSAIRGWWKFLSGKQKFDKIWGLTWIEPRTGGGRISRRWNLRYFSTFYEILLATNNLTFDITLFAKKHQDGL